MIGASAGAIESLSGILPELRENRAVPVIVVIHVPPDRDSLIAKIFQSKCRVKVKEVEDKEALRAGVVYIAPPDYHVLIEPDRRLSLSGEEQVQFSRPSIDVLFESAADAIGVNLLGIILTGGNSDGANGLRAILNCGGQGIVQKPETAYAKAMPLAAAELCPEAELMGLDEIALFVRTLVTKETI